MAHGVGVHGQERGLEAEARGGEGRFDPGMAGADDEDVVIVDEIRHDGFIVAAPSRSRDYPFSAHSIRRALNGSRREGYYSRSAPSRSRSTSVTSFAARISSPFFADQILLVHRRVQLNVQPQCVAGAGGADDGPVQAACVEVEADALVGELKIVRRRVDVIVFAGAVRSRRRER